MPLFIHGTFGIGKTKGVETYAKAKAKSLGLEFSKELHRIQITDLLRELPDEFTFQDIKRETLKFLLKEA